VPDAVSDGAPPNFFLRLMPMSSSVRATNPSWLELEYKLNTNGNQNVLAIAADAGSEDDVKALVDESIKKFGSIDYLVHAAGMGVLKPFSDSRYAISTI
jgi:NAD(P)-dependent dehydrogenase (short-subunit alcohol dehydrogenase family)